jgi:hypothetical protein
MIKTKKERMVYGPLAASSPPIVIVHRTFSVSPFATVTVGLSFCIANAFPLTGPDAVEPSAFAVVVALNNAEFWTVVALPALNVKGVGVSIITWEPLGVSVVDGMNTGEESRLLACSPSVVDVAPGPRFVLESSNADVAFPIAMNWYPVEPKFVQPWLAGPVPDGSKSLAATQLSPVFTTKLSL